MFIELKWFLLIQKQLPGGVLSKRCYENMLQIYREHPYRSVISVIEITLWHGCSPVNLLHIFRAPSYKNTSKWLLLLMSVSSTLNVKYCKVLHSIMVIFEFSLLHTWLMSIKFIFWERLGQVKEGTITPFLGFFYL